MKRTNGLTKTAQRCMDAFYSILNRPNGHFVFFASAKELKMHLNEYGVPYCPKLKRFLQVMGIYLVRKNWVAYIESVPELEEMVVTLLDEADEKNV